MENILQQVNEYFNYIQPTNDKIENWIKREEEILATNKKYNKTLLKELRSALKKGETEFKLDLATTLESPIQFPYLYAAKLKLFQSDYPIANDIDCIDWNIQWSNKMVGELNEILFEPISQTDEYANLKECQYKKMLLEKWIEELIACRKYFETKLDIHKIFSDLHDEQGRLPKEYYFYIIIPFEKYIQAEFDNFEFEDKKYFVSKVQNWFTKITSLNFRICYSGELIRPYLNLLYVDMQITAIDIKSSTPFLLGFFEELRENRPDECIKLVRKFNKIVLEYKARCWSNSYNFEKLYFYEAMENFCKTIKSEYNCINRFKLTTLCRFKLTTPDRFKLTSADRFKLTT